MSLEMTGQFIFVLSGQINELPYGDNKVSECKKTIQSLKPVYTNGIFPYFIIVRYSYSVNSWFSSGKPDMSMEGQS